MEKRPAGIAMLGIISFLGGIALAFVGIVLMGVMLFGPAVTGEGVFLAGLLTFAVGAMFLGVAVGFWLGFPWALPIATATAALGLLAGVLNLVVTGEITRGFATLVFPAFLLWYLNRDDVKRAFDEQG
ncbi:MAG TPA: hypothetical protein VFY23_14645 [Candidatus Limnocylindrales bacterium]|nr:hypothetical protein [Candidatus Limnocylindrales bacterium]